MGGFTADPGLRRSGLLLFLLVGLAAVLVGARAQAPDLRAGFHLELTGGQLDLNTATAAELAALPGMGPVYARRIIESRPYTAKNQLVTRGVLPQAAYDRVKDRVVAHRR